MIRMMLTVLLPLIAPTLIYFFILYMKAKWKKEDEGAEIVPLTHKLPLIRLVTAGAILLIITLVSGGMPSRTGLDDVYITPHMENGELIPGHFVPKSDGKETPAE